MVRTPARSSTLDRALSVLSVGPDLGAIDTDLTEHPTGVRIDRLHIALIERRIIDALLTGQFLHLRGRLDQVGDVRRLNFDNRRVGRVDRDGRLAGASSQNDCADCKTRSDDAQWA